MKADNTLTHDDIDILMDSLDALDSKESSDFTAKVMIGTMLARNPEEAKSRLAEAELEREQKSHIHRAAKEKLILVRAKLIQLRHAMDSADADTVFNDATDANG
jgi:hypothetical protein